MKILIPTAKELNKTAIAVAKKENSEQTKKIIEEFAGKTSEELGEIYKIKEEKAREEYSRWQNMKNGVAKYYPALELFNGLMYRSIAREDFTEDGKKYVRNNVYITTSLYGVINAYEGIEEHRLDFLQNVKISGQSMKNFWRKSYDSSVSDENFIISLLSSEFEEVFSKNVRDKFIKINFMEEKEGKLKTHSTISKKARGKFLTELVKRGITNKNELKNIEFDGFKYIKEQSTNKVFTFVAKR